ncbi:MAG: hypothetical protein CVU90_14920 [Firmicutes bacterium HGW-Firmicutes-15]|nr:MAG: hypothetical protein CVU90_14920 [Firmicutes bacterium HGW-Firmicutes-15]
MTTLIGNLKEFIAVRTPHLEGTYGGLGGTFATLADSCLRKKALPGFYDSGMIKTAEFRENKLFLVLSGRRTDADLMYALDVAIRNVGAFPFEGKALNLLIVEVSGEIEN